MIDSLRISMRNSSQFLVPGGEFAWEHLPGRGHASQMKAWEKLVAFLLVVVLEESESEREKNGEEPTVLRDWRVFVEELEKINQK